MSQKLVGKAFISVALIATVDLPAMAQAPLAPPPQIPYGVSVSTESAKNVAAASIAEAQKNNWKMAVAIVDTGAISCISKECRTPRQEASTWRSRKRVRQPCSGVRQNSFRTV